MTAKITPKGKRMTPDEFKSALKGLGLSQARVAAVWGCSRELVNRWANGKVPIPGVVRFAIAGIPVLREENATKPVVKPIEAPAKPSEPANVVAWSGLKKR